ncbi:MAG: Microsomal dipeptidase (EC [uncultured Sulfurovum sp.]|uniref:Microsomal dipeptidase (EC) n=1 Tax=uncultured Sulfurovum sp. TaxID=269237 RepID=A0A6S6TV48_9BACT|nr:MAG: Microsomal dipeptidase (EC [uncultured Sulfurovum sp.]
MSIVASVELSLLNIREGFYSKKNIIKQKRKNMNFIDFHCDTATLILEKGEELQQNNLTIDIEKLQKGEALAQFFAMYIDAKKVESSFDYCVKMLKTFKDELAKNQETISLCTTYDDLIATQEENKIAAFLSIEEGDALEGSLDKLRFFKQEGISAVTLTWNYENALGYPNFQWEHQNKGLKKKGFEAVEEMNHLNMLIDVSHLSDGGFKDVLEHSKSPFIATHSNARVMTNHPRNLSDKMLKQLADVGGLTGINFFNNFLVNGELKEKMEVAKIEDMVRHIKHIKKVAGVDVIGLGSDFDGIPNSVEIEDISQMSKLSDTLLKNGFSYDEVEKMFFSNGLRIIKDVLK